MSILESVKEEAKKSPKKIIFIVAMVAAILVVVAYRSLGNSDMSENASPVLAAEEKTEYEPKQIANGEYEPSSSARPESTELTKTIESMATDYVAGAINSNEALAFLVKQESQRILELDKSIAEYRRAINESQFQAELQKGKLLNVGQYVNADLNSLKNEGGDGIQGRNASQAGPYYQPPQQASKGNSDMSETVTDLGEYNLQAIFKVNGVWYAKLSTPSGKPINVRGGQKLGGGVEVKSLTESMVSLTNGKQERELLVY